MRSFIISAILLTICLPLFATGNAKTEKEAQFEQDVLDTLSQHPEIFETKNDAELAVEKLTAEYYKDTSNRQSNAFYALLILVAGAIFYVVFVDRKKYNEAVHLAEKAAERTERIEAQAQAILENIDRDAEAKLNEIDEKSEAKLNEIDEKGKTQIAALIKEAEKQRELSDLWSKAQKAHSDQDYITAIDLWKTIAKDLGQDKMDNLLHNWGCSLASCGILENNIDEKRRLFNESIFIYDKAVKIDNDHYLAYTGWGSSLIHVANLEPDKDEERRLLTEAIAKLEMSIHIQDDYRKAYNDLSGALTNLANIEKDVGKREALLNRAKKIKQIAENLKSDSTK